MNHRIREHHHTVRASDRTAPFHDQLVEVLDRVRDLTENRKVFFLRFFLSDAANQHELLEAAARERCVFPASVIQQPPLDGSKISAWLWTVEGDLNPIYIHKVCYGLANNASGPSEQMESIFSEYDVRLNEEGMSVADDCVRTWIFVRDVDTNYSGVVAGRCRYFDSIGLTADTHYIASTGIQGAHADFRKVVLMDAYAVKGLLPGQIRYLQAKDHLNPTYEYGVTFERGTCISYGDRKHIFISGTASIDNKGQILHEGDVRRQTLRMMENISALLSEAGAGIDDIRSAVLYLRDSSDYPVVSALIKERWPMLDPLVVQASVCRPGWLVEMECIASVMDDNDVYPPM